MAAVEILITDHLDLWTAALKRKSAAGRGSSSKVEMYGIKKLRELILELAVRGLLVPQDPNDEPASELLKKIAAEKAKLMKAGKIKKETSLPMIVEDEKLYALPKGWEWERLGSIGKIFNGNSVSATVKEERYMNIDGLPFIATKDVGYGFEDLDYKNGVFIPLRESGFKVARKGAVLVCAEGGSAGKKCGIANQDICFGNKLFANELYGDTNSRFVLSWYLTPTFFTHFSSAMTGIIGGISSAKFAELPVPVAPAQEQHRIVAKVDELMALCDQLEQQTDASLGAHQTLVETLLSALTSAADHAQFASVWQRIAGHFDTLFTTEESIAQLKQTILQLAVMGRLEGGASGGWEIQRLDKVCAEIVDCPHSTPKWTATGKICVRTSQFRPGKLDLSGCRFVSESTFDERVARLKPEPEDILYSREGGILGVACRVPPEVELCLGQRMMLMRPGKRIVSAYLELVLNSPVITSIAQQETTGGAAPRVNVSTVKSYPIPVPPLAEQHRIVAKVDELTALCDQLKSRLSDAQTTQLHLADALVERTIG